MKIITGMHRSGTSLMAQLCYEAGAKMGSPEEFYPPDRWNPQGYYEDLTVRKWNMRLIHGAWWKFAYLRLPSAEIILKRGRKIERQLSDAADHYAEYLVKDSRFCLTLPAWQHCGAKIDRIVICIREPREVVSSLQKRNGVPLGWAYELWVAHYRRLLQSLNDLPVRYLHYNRLVAPKHFAGEIMPCFRFLGLDISKDKVLTIGSQIVNPDMNHFLSDQNKYPSKVLALWHELLEKHDAQEKKT